MTETDTTAVVPDQRDWWKEAVVYQVYPRSFNDSDGDGVGDIPGIVEKVDYFDDLGIDCVWLTPVYESPQADFGYDIADYHAIHPEYGSMDDWDRLLEELHARDIRFVMDLVLNHTSEEHVWFQRSRAGDGAYDDYYFWRPGAGGDGDEGDYPNNWESHFDTPAWTYDEERGEYYLHLFTPEQPDLNWETPRVREEAADIVSWWLERGIDGFRLDVINEISKAPGLPDGDPDGELVGAEHHINGPRMHEYFDELAEQGFGDDRDRAVAIGECAMIDPETARDVTGRESDLLDMVITFDHTRIDGRDEYEYREWELSELKTVMAEWQEAVAAGAWIALYHSNHDQPRAVSRFGDPDYRYESATMLATWLHGHRGTPFVYQGEEIGMSNVSFESPDDLVDPWAQNHWENARAAGRSFEEVRGEFERFSRDNARTPMQWDSTAYAGFSEAEPWMPVADDYETVNVAADRARDRSIFGYYRDLIALRGDDDVLVHGGFGLLLEEHESIYAFRRHHPDHDYDLLVVCNFSAETPTFEAPDGVVDGDASVVLANYADPPADPARVELRPYEAFVYRV
jgi:glycosidase